MKKLILALVFLGLFSCDTVDKPDNLIEEDKMVNILYDIAVLDAVRSQKAYMLTQENINPATYVYKKHKIDSLQFANSNRYYATDIERYKKIYAKVAERIEKQRKMADSIVKKPHSSPAPIVPSPPPAQ